MKFINKIAVSLVVLNVIYSCGGGGDDPVPTPEANKPPSTPTQIFPASNELCINNAVNFQWNVATDPDGDSISYVVEVSENNSFSPIKTSKIVLSTSTVISLDKGVAYYWRVTAKDSKNASSNPSSANGFYTEGTGVSNYVPFSPELVSPVLSSIVQTASVTLEWSANDVENDALTYNVYLDTVNPPSTIVSESQSDKTYVVNPLTASTTYYWRVAVKDTKGGQSIGQVWSFTTD